VTKVLLAFDDFRSNRLLVAKDWRQNAVLMLIILQIDEMDIRWDMEKQSSSFIAFFGGLFR
jgi:hypothetical protein